jgi:prepilin-type N-terminal cleavage/methylation domain-containing protein
MNRQKVGNREQEAEQTLKEGGFTLIEMVVVIALFSLISYGLLALVSGILTNSNQEESLLANNDSARRVAFGLMSELRNAQTSATGAYALAAAADQSIIFYSYAGGSVNRIRYYVSGGKLYKGVTKPSGSPATYDLDTETVTLVQSDVANGSDPLFYYYDDSYNGTTDNPLSSPVSVTAVKFVKMNLAIYKRGRAGSTATYNVTASGAIRNLKTNLGE